MQPDDRSCKKQTVSALRLQKEVLLEKAYVSLARTLNARKGCKGMVTRLQEIQLQRSVGSTDPCDLFLWPQCRGLSPVEHSGFRVAKLENHSTETLLGIFKHSALFRRNGHLHT
jgi:hypothetical protein